MPEPTTPGQVAYAACLATLAPQAPWRLAWHELSDEYHRAWEAAAEAVLDAWLAQPRMETPTRRVTPPPLHTEDQRDA